MLSFAAIAFFAISVRVGAEPGVYRDHVEPHWYAGGTRFWYRNDLADGGREFVVVDAEHGLRRSAFDQAKVAAALAKILGRPVEARALPVDELEFAGDDVVILRGSSEWRLDLTTYEVKPTGDGAKPLVLEALRDPPQRTTRTGRATTITFINRTRGDVNIDWLSFEGERRHYATVAPGGVWESNTFDGHVWVASDRDGKTLGTYEAFRRAASVILEADTSAAPTTLPAHAPDATALAPRSRKRRSERPHEPGSADSPDGKWSIFVRDDNLFVRNRQTREETALSTDGNPGDAYDAGSVRWSPDSQKLIALRTEPAQAHPIYEVESSPKDQVQPKLRELNYLKPGDRIAHPRPQLFHIPQRQHVPVKEDLFPNPWSIDDLRWASDSSRVTFLYNQRGHQALRVIAIDASSGDTSTVVDEHSDTFIDYSGKLYCKWIGDDELLWMSERDGWNHLWLYDARAGRVKNQVTKGEFVVRSVVHVDEQKRQVWFMAGGVRAGQDPYYQHFCRVNFDGSGMTVLTEGDGEHVVQWSPGDRWFIDTWSRVDQPPITELRRSDTGALVCDLEEADAAEALASRGGRWPMRFCAKGRDGATDIYGIIVLPRAFDVQKTYPVLEEVYAGPHGFSVPKAFRTRYGTKLRMADRGMIVVQSDGMGTNWRSRAFHDVCWKNLRDAGFPDRIAWMKSAGAKFPQMDLSRVGIYGGSAGGQNAMAALLWHHDFYTVAVADCGCHDNRMDKIWWNEQWMGWPVDKSYEENSNVVNAGLLQGKLMLVVGELDSNVDPASTMQVVNALEKANKDFELVIVTGANHGAAETPYGSRRRAEFLMKNLDVAERP